MTDARFQPERVLVTGGAGFIGSNLIRLLLERGVAVLNVDYLSYAGNLATVKELDAHGNYRFEHSDINDTDAMHAAFAAFQPDAVMHLAAESHVDRSIDDPSPFIRSNILGTFSLLETSRAYLAARPDRPFRFVHVSTDEVHGSLGPAEPAFDENTPYRPNSPYSASKAASDHLARAWQQTYGLPLIITNCSNNYGPWQFPEKLIPLMIHKALAGEKLPVYGRGENVRDWLFVTDHCNALWQVLTGAEPGTHYHIGGNSEHRNIDLVTMLCRLLDRLLPDAAHAPHEQLIEFVTDRPAHDLRYAVDTARIERDLGWRPEVGFEEGLDQTVRWYLNNQDWCAAI
ncbi:MAG: dTDP-glucose 4,6-dehydratase, partial [Gammaproteobacteria bacterium]|nr:dTDP-glucose 4,6-dehydratase [Gammaproteobacteria bacterium]